MERLRVGVGITEVVEPISSKRALVGALFRIHVDGGGGFGVVRWIWGGFRARF